MKNEKTFVTIRQTKKQELLNTTTISDLRDREYSAQSLTNEEWMALRNYDKFRITELNKELTDMEFHEKYRELQVMANLGDYKEFLKEKYSSL
ncbi:MAG: hypothetical protein J0M08_09655 [Bacteroidetes bacterium]|nr:hypothetical protein [Bacteroidota bacterium]